jgi:hypothetical protein
VQCLEQVQPLASAEPLIAYLGVGGDLVAAEVVPAGGEPARLAMDRAGKPGDEGGVRGVGEDEVVEAELGADLLEVLGADTFAG